MFTLLKFSGHLISMWRSKRCKHVHGEMEMLFVKHTSHSFNITSKNATCIPTWYFLFNILIFFTPIYFSIKFLNVSGHFIFINHQQGQVISWQIKQLYYGFMISKILVYIFNIFFCINREIYCIHTQKLTSLESL